MGVQYTIEEHLDLSIELHYTLARTCQEQSTADLLRSSKAHCGRSPSYYHQYHHGINGWPTINAPPSIINITNQIFAEIPSSPTYLYPGPTIVVLLVTHVHMVQHLVKAK